MATAVFENLNATVCCRDSEERAHSGKVKTTMPTGPKRDWPDIPFIYALCNTVLQSQFSNTTLFMTFFSL